MATRAKSAGRTRGVARRRGRLAPGKAARGLDAADVALALDAAEVAELTALVRSAGGAPIGAYREPLGGRALLLAALPLAAVQPTPFQRDLSPTHAKRLAASIDETGAFLDPLIVVRGEDGGLWTPNGRHRLAAAKVLGLKQITALISPDESLAYRILALNTEKAHNLRDRSLEVIRMARNLAARRGREAESAYRAQFEAPELLTLGIVYQQSGALRRRRLQPVPEEGRSLQRAHARCQPAPARGLRRAAARDRRARQDTGRRAAGARLQVAVPAQLRGGAHQPGPLPQGEEGRRAPRHAARRGADAHGRSGTRVQPRRGVELGSRLGGGGRGLGR